MSSSIGGSNGPFHARSENRSPMALSQATIAHAGLSDGSPPALECIGQIAPGIAWCSQTSGVEVSDRSDELLVDDNSSTCMAIGTTAPAVICQTMNSAAIVGSVLRQDFMSDCRICLPSTRVKLIGEKGGGDWGFGIRGSGIWLFGNNSSDERFVQRVDVIVEGALTRHLKHGGLSTLPGNQESHARHLRTVGARMIVVRTREHVVRSHVLVDERDTPSNSD